MCQYRNFSIYEYPPPDMKKGCEAFMAGWSEEVEKALINRKNNEDIEDYVCYKLTNVFFLYKQFRHAKMQKKDKRKVMMIMLQLMEKK